MKYSFMTFSCPELTLAEALAAAREYGYDGIEPRAESDHKHGVEISAGAGQREEIKRKSAETGVALCCVATSCRYADPAAVAETVERTHAYIDLAADVGAPRLRVFGGQMPEGIAREKAVAAVADALKSTADHAGERGIVICVETHDAWCHPDHLAAVMQRVDHPAVGVNWDIMHPVRSGGATMASAYETLKPWIRHVHFHDGAGDDKKFQLVPAGEGIVDHAAAVKLLLAADYRGYLSGEWIGWTPYAEHLPRELATMKRYESATG